jgi:hypothetical protein
MAVFTTLKFSELQVLVKDELQNDPIFTAERVKDAINLAYIEAVGLTRYNPAVDSATPTVASQQDYSEPTGCLNIFEIKCGSLVLFPKSYREIFTLEDSDTVLPTGSPEYWFIGKTQGKYGLYPTPKSAGETLKVWYNKAPTLLSADSDLPIFNLTQIELLIFGALERLCRKDNESTKQKGYRALFLQGIGEVLISLENRSSHVIRIDR